MPNNHANHNPHDHGVRLNRLLAIADEQHLALNALQKIINRIRIHLAGASITSLYSEINHFTKYQNDRFHRIDELINENIMSIKKGKINNNRVFYYGKEIRKIEANIQKVKLMICAVINMILPKMDVTQIMLEHLQFAVQHIDITKKDINDTQISIQKCM